jgi:exodeoxyribonuclease VII large subunit
MRRELRSLSAHFDNVGLRLKRCHPGTRLLQQEQRLDDLEQRLAHALRSNIRHDRGRVSDLYARLVHRSPDRLVRDFRLRHVELARRLQQAMKDRFSRSAARVDMDARLGRAIGVRLSDADSRYRAAARTLHAVSPLRTIERGFAVVTREDGSLVTDVRAVSIGDEITTRLAHGRLRARVTGKED